MAGRSDVIPGSSDEYVTNMITLFCRLFKEPPLSLVAELNETKAANLARPDMNLVNVCDLALTIVAFKSGQLAKGWGMLKEIIPWSTPKKRTLPQTARIQGKNPASLIWRHSR